MKKNLAIIFGIIFCMLNYSCSSDDDFDYPADDQTEELGDTELRGASVNYIINEVVDMKSYLTKNRVRPNVNNYTESYYLPYQVDYMEYLGLRYFACKNLNNEANVYLYRIYNTITGNESLGRHDDTLKPGDMRCEHFGFIYDNFRMGLVPLMEFYSAKNQNNRYLIHNYEVEKMKKEGQDYQYVRTLGYVCPYSYHAPYIVVSYTSKSNSTYDLSFDQVTYGKRVNRWNLSIGYTPGRVIYATSFQIGGMFIYFNFYNPTTKTRTLIGEYVPEGSRVNIDINEYDDIELWVTR